MNKLFENWRRYLHEGGAEGHRDPDSDADDAAELRDIAADIEQKAGSSSLSEHAKNKIRSYLNEWFNEAAATYRNDPTSPYKAQQLIRDLKKGVARQGQDPYSASVDFNHMLKSIKPEDQEAAANFLGDLAQKVEETPDFVNNWRHAEEVIEQMLNGQDPGSQEA